jgi:hypothetical protein
MSKLTSRATPKTSDEFDEQVDILFEELSLAIRWHRPSILLAVYESKALPGNVKSLLARRLEVLGHGVSDYRVNKTGYDIPLALSEHPGRNKLVFFVSGLRSGGGTGGNNAYRALNMRREFFVDFSIRAVFWLTRTEASALPRRAPDFWAFRHRVVEFANGPAPRK